MEWFGFHFLGFWAADLARWNSARLSLARCPAGVILDCGRHEVGNGRKDDDDWWLDLYVLLSRATRSEDLLLTRAPPVDFLLRGPPAGLHKQLHEAKAKMNDKLEELSKAESEVIMQSFSMHSSSSVVSRYSSLRAAAL